MKYSISNGIAVCLLTVLATPMCCAQGEALVIRGGQIFDSVSDESRANPGILIVNGRIAAVGIDDAVLVPENAREIDLDDGSFLMPGIIDLHAHYNINVMQKGRVDETEHYSIIYLANGVTTTFPAGEYNPQEMLAMRMRIDRGEQIGPRVLNSGPYYGLSMRRSATKQEVYDRVDEWAAKGARGFKAKSISPSQLQALIDRAHMHGLTVTAHLDSGFRNSVNPRDAILMGIDRVEHFLGGDLLPDSRSAYATLENLTDVDIQSPAFDEIVRLFIDRHVFFDATLTAYGYFGAQEDDPVYEQWTDESRFFHPAIAEWAARGSGMRQLEQFKRIFEVKKKTLLAFYRAGGGHLITLGTDHVSTGQYVQGFSVHREMHAMNRAGIPAAAVLKIATINSARAIGVGDRLGTIEAGKFADLIIIDGNPLEDIRNTHNVRTVIKNGVVYDAADLLKSVKGKLGSMLVGDAGSD